MTKVKGCIFDLLHSITGILIYYSMYCAAALNVYVEKSHAWLVKDKAFKYLQATPMLLEGC